MIQGVESEKPSRAGKLMGDDRERGFARAVGPGCNSGPEILMPSIVDFEVEYNGAATVSRGLTKLLASPPLCAKVHQVPLSRKPSQYRRLRQFSSLLRSCVSPLPSKALFGRSRRFRREIKQRLRSQNFQLVLLNGSDLLWLLEELPTSVPQIVVAHNIEHLLFEGQIDTLGWTPRPLRNLLDRDCRRLRQFEMDGLRRVANILFLSKQDAKYAQSSLDESSTLTIPPLFDYTPPKRVRPELGRVLDLAFVGNGEWWPNRSSLAWFLDEVFPNTDGTTHLHVFGPDSGDLAPDHPRIVKHGPIGLVSDAFRQCHILICPDRSRWGVSVKLAEALYNDTPVLARSCASRGLALDDDPALVLLDEPRDWVEFLNSASARSLANRRVSVKTAGIFSIDTHKHTVQQFVQGVLSLPSHSKLR